VHLPQIAAYGSSHFRIEKNVKSGRTSTTVAALEGPERQAEIARMIGGADVTPSMLAGAREMLAAKAAVTRRTRPSKS
jgi:DNA repair protein RecN (Recombination protein N)